MGCHTCSCALHIFITEEIFPSAMSGTTGTSFPEASTANIPLFSVIHMDSNPETTTYTESSFENATTDVYIQSTEADSGDGVILRPQGVLMLIYLVTGTLGVLGNSGVLLVMVSVSKLRKKLTNLFIIHQVAIRSIMSNSLPLNF